MKKIRTLYNIIRNKFFRTAAEDRFLNYYKNRWDAIDNLADYLVGAEIPGDYLEFGVAQGETFSYACNVMSPVFKDMRFFALDSFEGLPKPKGIDNLEGYSSSFYEGQYSCSEKEFTKKLSKKDVNLNKVTTVKGWFDQTLTEKNAQKYDINNVAAAWIDCDYYESTVSVLNFLTKRITVGSVLLFDDWRCYRNLPDFGEQRACREWLSVNPQIKLYELFSFGWHGIAFTVGSC
jgi:O-methyltransferase